MSQSVNAATIDIVFSKIFLVSDFPRVSTIEKASPYLEIADEINSVHDFHPTLTFSSVLHILLLKEVFPAPYMPIATTLYHFII